VSDSGLSIPNTDVSSASAEAASANDRSSERNDTDTRDPSEIREQGQTFRDLMKTPLTARELAQWSAETADGAQGRALGGMGADPWAPEAWATWASDRGAAEFDTTGTQKGAQGLTDQSNAVPLDVSAMMHAQQAIGAGAAPQSGAPTASSAPDASLAELIEKHVRRVLAAAQPRSGDGEVRIELSDAVFPGTALSLRRTNSGWELTATADNRQSLDKLKSYAPDLIERFAQASLGQLQVSI
jgi:hypothetical protein